MTSVSKLSILSLVVYFVIYIVLHITIGLIKNKVDKDLKEKPDDEKTKFLSKILKQSFNWFPAIYLIFIIVMFYA